MRWRHWFGSDRSDSEGWKTLEELSHELQLPAELPPQVSQAYELWAEHDAQKFVYGTRISRLAWRLYNSDRLRWFRNAQVRLGIRTVKDYSHVDRALAERPPPD